MPTPKDAPFKLAQAEADARLELQGRESLYRAALNAAVLSSRRYEFCKRLALRQGIGLDFWPEAQPLTAQERTAILGEIRKIFGLPEGN